MNLSTYIEKNGDAFCADLFGVPLRTVASWRRRERVPRPKKAAEIIDAAKGDIDIHGIYLPETSEAA